MFPKEARVWTKLSAFAASHPGRLTVHEDASETASRPEGITDRRDPAAK